MTSRSSFCVSLRIALTTTHVARQHTVPHGPESLAPEAVATTGKRKSYQAALDASIASSAGTGSDHPYPLDLIASSDTPASRIQKRPRLLGSPFDLAKRVASRTNTTASRRSARGRSGLLIDESEEGDSGFRASDFDMELGFDFDFDPEIEGDDLDLDVSSSGGPQRSGLPAGDVFSPRAMRGGRGSISFDFEEEREKEMEEERSRAGIVRLGGVRPTWMLSPVDE